MFEDSKAWVFLVIFTIVVGVGYGAHYLSSVDSANATLLESRNKLAGVNEILVQRKSLWADLEKTGNLIRQEMAQNEVLLKAKDVLDKRHQSVESGLSKAVTEMKAAVEKNRAAAAGTDLGDLTLNNGRILRGAKIRKLEESGVALAYADGIGTIPLSDMPENLIAKYDFGPNAVMPGVIKAQTTFLAQPPITLSDTTPAASNTTAAATTSTTKPGEGKSSFDSSSLVIIKTDTGSGSGFIASQNGKTYVYTNAHVICGSPGGFTSKIVSIKTASGKTIANPYDIDLSITYDASAPNGLEDVARFPVAVTEGTTVYEIPSDDLAVTVNQSVVAYGNSLGADVVTSLEGTVLGLGTDRIEISCDIVPGNSGGPVVLQSTKQVLGISTYLDSGERNIWSSNTKFAQVRRFAVRPNKVKQWRKMQLSSLFSALTELRAFDRDSLSLAAACYLNPKPNNGGFDIPSTQQGDYIIKQVIVDGSKHTLGALISSGIAKVNQRLGGSKSAMSVAGVVPVFNEFFATVSQASTSQADSLSISDRVPYLKQFIPAIVARRRAIQAAFVNEGNTRFNVSFR